MFICTKPPGVAALALVLFAGLMPMGAAQDEPHRDRVDVVSPSDRVDVAPICPPSSSRVAAACERQVSQTVVRVGTELSSEIEVSLPEPTYCEATIAIEYTQRVTIARVEGTIQNPDCAASKGNYVVAVSVRDESDELKTIEYTESWQRDDDRPVTFTADYQIGENVDLVSVRPRRLRCACVRAEN